MYCAWKSICDGLVYWYGPGVAVMRCVGRVLLSVLSLAFTVSLFSLPLPLPYPLLLLKESGTMPLLLHVGRGYCSLVEAGQGKDSASQIQFYASKQL